MIAVVMPYVVAAVLTGLVVAASAADRARALRPVRHARRVRYVPASRPPAPLPEVEEWEL